MKYNYLLILLVILVNSCKSNTNDADLILSNVNVINIINGEVYESKDVFIKDGIISEIISHNPKKDRPGLQIDSDGRYLIPGLWDMHVHAIQDVSYANALPMYIANGITGIRDMSGDLRLRDSLQKIGSVGGLPIPRMKVAGAILGGNPARNGTNVATIEEGIEYVEILAANGADFIKTYEYLKPEVYEAILKKSNELNIPVYGHPPKLVGPQKAIELGQKSFEHLSQIPYWCTPFTDLLIKDMYNHWYGPGIPMASKEFEEMILQNYNDSILESLAIQMINNDVYFCPTIMVYENLTYPWIAETANRERIKYLNPFMQWSWRDDISWAKEKFQQDSIGFIPKLENRKHILSRLIEYGVPIVAGTDAGVTMHGFDLHKELILYVELGMTPLQALQSATLNSVELLKLNKNLGIVAKGYKADLVLLKENPLEDIRNTQSIEGVIIDGKYIYKDSINSVLSDIKEQNKKTVVDTLRKVLAQNGVIELLRLTKQWEKEPEVYNLSGSQLTLLSYEMMQKDRMKEAEDLLKEEIRINSFDANFAHWSLVELMGEIHGSDSAQVYGKRYLDIFGPSHVHINSFLKRTTDLAFGKPKYQQIDSLKIEALQGNYVSNNSGERIKLLWSNNSFKMMINSQLKNLSALNDSVFHLQGSEPDRIIIRNINKESREIYYISGRSEMIFNKERDLIERRLNE